jgi:hypothetical protein
MENYSLSHAQIHDARMTANRMLRQYAKSRNDSALDAALDYRHSYDRGTYGWVFWDAVINFLRSVRFRKN